MAKANSTRRTYNFIDLTGQRCGRWTVIGEANTPSRHVYWNCVCECGTHKIVRGSALTSGHSNGCKPCGKRKHGMTGTPEYVNWQRMNGRCRNPQCKDFPEYGGRGITICDRWRSFAAFYADMGPRPSPVHSIDRYPDQDGNYEPNNCRWATPTEQSRNRHHVRPITFNGATQYLPDWSAQLGIAYGTLYGRLKKGWTTEKAFTTPPRTRSQPTVVPE